MKKMMISSAVKTHYGNLREENEDNFLIGGKCRDLSNQNVGAQLAMTPVDDRSSLLFAVCDGMGGEHYGEIASSIAVHTLNEFDRITGRSQLEDFIHKANIRICEEMTRRKIHRMGTTAAVLCINKDRASICSLGDSRIYMFHEGRLRQLSVDHREITPFGKYTVLTQHLGVYPDEFELEPFIIERIKLLPGMTFLLCSDGLTDMVSDEEIGGILRNYKKSSTTQVVEELVNLALQNGGKDNVTALIARVNAE